MVTWPKSWIVPEFFVVLHNLKTVVINNLYTVTGHHQTLCHKVSAFAFAFIRSSFFSHEKQIFSRFFSPSFSARTKCKMFRSEIVKIRVQRQNNRYKKILHDPTTGTGHFFAGHSEKKRIVA